MRNFWVNTFFWFGAINLLVGAFLIHPGLAIIVMGVILLLLAFVIQ